MLVNETKQWVAGFGDHSPAVYYQHGIQPASVQMRSVVKEMVQKALKETKAEEKADTPAIMKKHQSRMSRILYL